MNQKCKFCWNYHLPMLMNKLLLQVWHNDPGIMDGKKSFQDNEAGQSNERLPFTIGGFYGNTRPSLVGSNIQEKILHVEEKTKLMEERPLPRNYNPGLLGPPSIWQTFARQVEAIRYSQLQGQGLMVFSYESDAVGSNGKRRYVVTHPRLLWLRLLDRNPTQRCSYEVIQEHSVCKLYFDLEFLYEHNAHKNGNIMIKTFIQIVCHFILKEFNIKCSRKNIIDLSSSSSTKFSRHLIFILPNVAFATNIHVGNFVIMVCNKIRDWRHASPIEVSEITREDVTNLFIRGGLEKEVLFCDEGVYTKNRNFRILHATKLRKNTPLEVAPENQYHPVTRNGISESEQFFLDSLVTTVDENCSVLTYGETSSKVQRLPKMIKRSKSEFEGCSSSPYPEIDSHMMGVVEPGYIRCWFYFSHTEKMVYEISQNRYCYNIGREHKSNSVMYVVDLKAEVYYQKCHDPDCREFRSAVWPLPAETLIWKHLPEEEMMTEAHSAVRDFLDSDSDDEILASALTKAEQEEKMVLGEELLSRAKTMEVWDHLDMLSSIGSSLQGSQCNTQNLSQTSNPWDKLSQLSTPDSSFFANWPENCTSDNNVDQGDTNSQAKANSFVAEPISTMEMDSDEEFAKEAARVERETAGVERELHCKGSDADNTEIEFDSYKI